MDSIYEKKQSRRRKQINLRQGSHKIDERPYKKAGSKKSKQAYDITRDLYLDNGRYSSHSEISMISDNGASDYIEYLAMIPHENETGINNMFSSASMAVNQVPDIANFADWIKTDKELCITPLDERYNNLLAMKNQCRKAEPVVDATILHDLQRAFDNLSPGQLFKAIGCCRRLPYSIRSGNDQINETAAKYMYDWGLTVNQLFRINDICQQILYRSSYGVLFIRDNKFFAKITQHHKKLRSAIKGYSVLKSNGEWENPWETTVGITKQDVQHWNSEDEEWQSFDMDEHIKEVGRLPYLECLVNGVRNTPLVRYIGMFIIRLKPNVQIRVKDHHEVDITNGNWYPLDMNIENLEFYTICPFLQYLQEHPDFA